MLILKYSDFNCPPCYDSVIMQSNILNYSLPSDRQMDFIALMCEDRVMFNQDRVNRWKATNEFPFNIMFVPESIFVKFEKKVA